MLFFIKRSVWCCARYRRCCFSCPCFAALALAEGLAPQKDAKCGGPRLIAIEKDPRATAAARGLIEKSSFKHLIHVVTADAMKVLQCLAAKTENHPSGSLLTTASDFGGFIWMPKGGFDLIYLDAEKKMYGDYVAAILGTPLLAPDGVLLMDNTLWFKGQNFKKAPCWDEPLSDKEVSRARRYTQIAEAMDAVRNRLRKDARINHVRIRH